MKLIGIVLIIFFTNINADEERIINDKCLNCIQQASSGCSHLHKFTQNFIPHGPFYLSQEYWNKSGISKDIGLDFESCANENNYSCSADVVRKYILKHTKTNLTNDDIGLCYKFSTVHGHGIINNYYVNRYLSLLCYHEIFNDCYIKVINDYLNEIIKSSRSRWG